MKWISLKCPSLQHCDTYVLLWHCNTILVYNSKLFICSGKSHNQCDAPIHTQLKLFCCVIMSSNVSTYIFAPNCSHVFILWFQALRHFKKVHQIFDPGGWRLIYKGLKSPIKTKTPLHFRKTQAVNGTNYSFCTCFKTCP